MQAFVHFFLLLRIRGRSYGLKQDCTEIQRKNGDQRI